MTILCRDCATHILNNVFSKVCPECRSTRLITHDELNTLNKAHIDCDAFFASVEKRDDPSIIGKAVIVGGGKRGVVAACCYVARIRGVRSAMPMFEALKLCPNAVVIHPNMEKYKLAGREVRALMTETTPQIEPISVDEAFLDLSGTEKLHNASAAQTLIKLVKRIENEVGISASIGLSYNKFLAKIASDLDKPRGFSIIGQAEALAFLTVKPVGLLWGVGKVLQKKLATDGIDTIGELRRFEEITLVKRYGAIGHRLYNFSRGQDTRSITPSSKTKSISAETTFNKNISDLNELLQQLWPLCEKISNRLKEIEYAGGGITLKLKQSDFKQITRSQIFSSPTQLAEEIYRVAKDLLKSEVSGRTFRLVGIGATRLCLSDQAGQPNFLDPKRKEREDIERVIDIVRSRFGAGSIIKGRSLK
jgi:DNA polymerase-4